MYFDLIDRRLLGMHYKSWEYYARKSWNIKEMRQKMGAITCRRMLFGHAILGCDTASRLYGIGKGLAVKLLVADDEDFNDAADIFLRKNATKKEIAAAGEKAIIVLYGGHRNVNINENRYDIFKRKVSTSTNFVHPKSLPPTASACKQHCFRVYH